MTTHPPPELALQHLLRSSGLEGTVPLAIKARRHAQYPQLVCFKYNQRLSPMADAAVQEARGLILDEDDNWNVVSMSFTKFFNLEEQLAAEIDWDSAVVEEKLDGSLMSLYWYDGAWQVQSSGTADASGPVLSPQDQWLMQRAVRYAWGHGLFLLVSILVAGLIKPPLLMFDVLGVVGISIGQSLSDWVLGRRSSDLRAALELQRHVFRLGLMLGINAVCLGLVTATTRQAAFLLLVPLLTSASGLTSLLGIIGYLLKKTPPRKRQRFKISLLVSKMGRIRQPIRSGIHIA